MGWVDTQPDPSPVLTPGWISIPPPRGIIGGAIASGEAFGLGAFSTGPRGITGIGIASGVAFGLGQFSGVTPIVGVGIASSATFGLGVIGLGSRALTGVGIASGEAFGTGLIGRGPRAITGIAIPSGEAFGSGVFGGMVQPLIGVGIATAEAFGLGVIGRGPRAITGGAIPTAEAFGLGLIGRGSRAITGIGIASGEAFGLGTMFIEPSFTPYTEYNTNRTNEPVPDGAVGCLVTLHGGGAAGGMGGNQFQYGGSGGGGGAKIKVFILIADLGPTYSVTRGLGGVAGASPTAGGASTFSSGTRSLSAGGGQPGSSGANPNPPGGAGGTPSTTNVTGADTAAGKAGGAGYLTNAFPGESDLYNNAGAGGGGGTVANNTYPGGTGGDSKTRSGGVGQIAGPGAAPTDAAAGNGGAGGAGGSSSYAGGDGGLYGGGGGGAGHNGTYGGDGGDGGTVVEWVDEVPLPELRYVGGAQVLGTSVSLTGLGLQADDTIVCFAYRDGSSTTIPSTPTGFTNVSAEGANTNTQNCSYKLRATGSETTVAAANATAIVVGIYRNVASVGANARATGATADPTYPALTLTAAPSWVVGMAGHRQTNGVLVAPTGMVNRVASANSTADIVLHDTNGAVSSWTAQTPATGETASGWQSCTLELVPVT